MGDVRRHTSRVDKKWTSLAVLALVAEARMLMKFAVYGGFKVTRSLTKPDQFAEKQFWTVVEKRRQGLSKACGCYVFALNNGSNFVSWYVGKTEKKTFDFECFEPHKIRYYNEIVRNHNGIPYIFLLPRLTVSGNKLSKPTSGRYRDVDYLESLMIGMALEKNPNLLNIQKTKLLREMVVPGIINSPQGKPSHSQRDLKIALGQ